MRRGHWTRAAVVALVIGGCGDDGASSGSSMGTQDGDGDGDGTVAGTNSMTSASTTAGSGSASGEGSGDGSSDTVSDPALTCVMGQATGNPPDPDHPGTAMGDNGSFADECDADGNLLEYVCETMEVCSDPPNPDCQFPQTGDVVPQLFDCDGMCQGGACNARCAMDGDELVWVEVGPDTAVFDNLTDGRRYACVLLFDEDSDTFDCNATPMPGDETTVTSLGLHGSFCTGGEWGNIGIGSPEQCAYGCTYQYD